MRKDYTAELEEVVFEKNKNRAIRRKNNIKKALRKQRLTRELYGDDFDYYDNLHEYSKNKIHCSCPICSDKTNNKNRQLPYKYKEFDMWSEKPISKRSAFGVGVINQGKPNKVYSPNAGRTNHRKGKNWTISDIRKLERCKSQLEDLNGGDII